MPSGSSAYRFGPFELDAPRGRLFWRPTRVPLSDPQAAILVQLVAPAGEVVSTHTLATGQDGRRYIETVPNRGYRFAAVIERAQGHDPDASLDAPLANFARVSRDRPTSTLWIDDAILRARRAFEDVLHAAPDDSAAHVGLANACGLAFESTRVDIVADVAGFRRTPQVPVRTVLQILSGTGVGSSHRTVIGFSLSHDWKRTSPQ